MFHRDLSHTGRSHYRGSQSGELAWSYSAGESVNSSPAIGADGRVYVGSDDNNLYVFEGPPPNYINLSVSPASVVPGSTVTLSYWADFSTYPYSGVPLHIYIAAIRAASSARTACRKPANSPRRS